MKPYATLKNLCLSLLLLSLCFAGKLSATPPKPSVSTYEKEILPLFQSKCLGCHGAGKAQAGLDLRTFGSLLQGGSVGKVLVVGSPEQSRIYQAVSSGKMPPGNPKMTPKEQQQLALWIRTGAHGNAKQGGHWAFKSPLSPSVPKNGEQNSVDAFLKEPLKRIKADFAPEAERGTLLRRVTYDLIGLPPTLQEREAFQKDTTPQAYQKVVDRLLADPRYGERWARYWLDTAGYADSEGVLQEDRIRPNAWRYRDYVIRSLNADKPYNRFLLEQIAGDELYDYKNAKVWTPEMEEALVATGFLRTAVDGTRDDFNEHQFTEYQYRMLNDTQTILVSSTLGITMQCARCHDHKYEPLSQKDYYRIQACLTGAIRPKGKLLPTNRRQIVAATAADQKRMQEVNAQVDSALQALAQKEQSLIQTFRAKPKVPKEATPAQLVPLFPEFKIQQDALQKERGEQEGKRIHFEEIRALYDQDATPPPTNLLKRGEITQPLSAVEPGVPTILDSLERTFTLPKLVKDATTTGRRRALAEWITHPQNPLSARVIVNRIWAHHFGIGIVATPDNFGLSGQKPTHPELLDWLATQLPKGFSGSPAWTLKALHRLIITSRAYRQSSEFRPALAKLDPENRLLWRQRPRRLEAEAIRDGILATAGILDPTLYGTPVDNEVRGTGEVVAVQEQNGGRRSLYLLVRRSLPVTFLNVFDAPVMETNCTRRVTSTTPTQALTILNSSFMESQSAHFAQRVERETPATMMTDYESKKAKIRVAFRLAFGRIPTENEMKATLGFLQAQTLRYNTTKKPKEAGLSAFTDLCLALLSSNEFVYLD